ncbi:MAG: hypothetical protein RML72_12150 [Bacteroidia bacterium]|nr:hypothetical protein [Bacteroidia bacterium]MDW8159610.1 hypothetical protein [Bacteroidia bacterium]
MYDYCISHTTLLDTSSEWHQQTVHIYIHQGVIVKITHAQDSNLSKAHKSIEAKGTFCVPGLVAFLVDLPEPGFEYRDTLSNVSNAALASGFTDIVFLPNSSPVLQDSRSLQALQQQTKNLPIHCHFTCAITKNAQGKELNEILELYHNGAIAFTDGIQPIQEPEILINALRYIKPTNSLLIQIPIDFRIFYNGNISESPITTGFGLKATPILAETLMLQLLLACATYVGSPIHISPITTAHSLEILKTYDSFAFITTSTALEYLIWDSNAVLNFDSTFKLHPPLQSSQHRQALIQALIEDSVDAIAIRHSPKSLEEKEVEYEYALPGMLYLPFALPLAYQILCIENNFPLEKLIDKLGNSIRKILNLPTIHIAPGNEAKLTLFQKTEPTPFQWQKRYSKSSNYPHQLPPFELKVKGIFNKGKWFSEQ